MPGRGEGTSDRFDEDSLIQRFFAPLADHPGSAGLKDDAASFSVPAGLELVVTADAVVSGVHFFAEDSPFDVARKALRVNISDLVAKGAKPAAYVLTLALGDGWSQDWIAGFAAGLSEDQARYGIVLLGGDTVRTPGPTAVSITALGLVPQGRMPRRTKGGAGELLFVTGTIGDAALGLMLRNDPEGTAGWELTPGERTHLLARYLLPDPWLAAAPLVLEFATASMDVSDGLAIDIERMCDASGLSAEVDFGRIPLSPAARRATAAGEQARFAIVTGGDDYEVLFAVRPQAVEPMQAAARLAGVPVTCIGRLLARGDATLRVLREGQPVALVRSGFRHF